MDTLSVVTLNLWNLSGPLEARTARIIEGLRALDPDVVCLQECLQVEGFDQAESLATPLGMKVAFGRMGDAPYPFGNAILSRWPLTLAEVSRLPTGGTDENRCVVMAHAETPRGRLPIAATHLNWRLDEGGVRARQVCHLVEVIERHADEGDLPPLLVGDFNAEPDSDEIRFLHGLTRLEGRSVYFNDAWRTAGDGGPGYTYARRNDYAAPCREPDRRIDYIFVKGPNARYEGYPIEARVILDQPDADGVWASDHFGLYAKIGL